jgi:hypothetical protein
MSETQWEYCELSVTGSSVPWGQKDHAYRGTLFFCGPEQQHRTVVIGDLKKPVPINPFRSITAQLGERGWELVSVQHGMYEDGPGGTSQLLRFDNRVAYFKRPVRAGRAVDQPPLVIEI